MPPANVYRFYNEAGQLLYVGCTGAGAARWVEHSITQPWWGDVTTVRVEHYPTREDALQAEENWIKNGNPIHNLMRYEHKPPSQGIYRSWHEGSIYQITSTGHWCASIRLDGKRHYFWGGRDREKAERGLAEFRREHGLDVEDAA